MAGTDFRDANLRDVDFSGVDLCSRDETTTVNGVIVSRGSKIECGDFRGADVHGADFAGVVLCDRNDGKKSCTPVDAATLRAGTHSSFDGARLP